MCRILAFICFKVLIDRYRQLWRQYNKPMIRKHFYERMNELVSHLKAIVYECRSTIQMLYRAAALLTMLDASMHWQWRNCEANKRNEWKKNEKSNCTQETQIFDRLMRESYCIAVNSKWWIVRCVRMCVCNCTWVEISAPCRWKKK